MTRPNNKKEPGTNSARAVQVRDCGVSVIFRMCHVCLQQFWHVSGSISCEK